MKVYKRARVREYLCVRVCACVVVRARSCLCVYMSSWLSMVIYISVLECVYVWCVCVCVRASACV